MGKISHEFTVQCGKTEPTTVTATLGGESNPNFKMPSSKYVRVERCLLEGTLTILMEKPCYTFISSTNSYYLRTAQRVERKPLFLLCLDAFSFPEGRHSYIVLFLASLQRFSMSLETYWDYALFLSSQVMIPILFCCLFSLNSVSLKYRAAASFQWINSSHYVAAPCFI